MTFARQREIHKYSLQFFILPRRVKKLFLSKKPVMHDENYFQSEIVNYAKRNSRTIKYTIDLAKIAFAKRRFRKTELTGSSFQVLNVILILLVSA